MTSGPGRIKAVTPVLIWFIPALTFILLSACKRDVPEREAESILRAFDYELLNIAKQVQNTTAYSAINTLRTVRNAPLPYFTHESEAPGGIRKFNFSGTKGIYHVDPENMTAFKTGPSDSIIIHLNDSSVAALPVTFIISEYEEEPSSSNVMFPVLVKAAMFVGDNLVMRIDHSARLEYDLPVQADISMILENFGIEATMRTRLRRKYGRMELKAELSRNGSVEAILDKKARLGLTGPGALYFKRLRMNFSMYPVILDINVNNDAISRDASNYIDEFTRHSRMFAYKMSDRRRLGEINLLTRENSDKLDYAMFFNNGSYLFVDDFLISARQILSIKK